MRFSEELVRHFFLRSSYWAIPVSLTLLALCGLVFVTDGQAWAPLSFAGSF